MTFRNKSDVINQVEDVGTYPQPPYRLDTQCHWIWILFADVLTPDSRGKSVPKPVGHQSFTRWLMSPD